MRFKASQVLRSNIATKKKKILQFFKGHYGISLVSIHSLDDIDLINKPRKTFQNMFGLFFFFLIYLFFSPHFHASSIACVKLSKSYFWSVLDGALARYICLAGFVKTQSNSSRDDILQ